MVISRNDLEAFKRNARGRPVNVKITISNGQVFIGVLERFSESVFVIRGKESLHTVDYREVVSVSIRHKDDFRDEKKDRFDNVQDEMRRLL